MFLVPSSKHSIRRVNMRIASAMRDHAHLILALVVLIAFALVMYRPAVTVKSRELNVVRAEGLGKGIYNFRDGRELAVEYRGSERAVTALRSGQATPAAVAVADLDNNGTPDLIAGYAANGIGLVTIQRGNPEAYAPTDESIYPKLQSGYNPEALLSSAEAYEAPITIEYLAVGNFDDNAQKDVLIASSMGGLYLMKGDGRGNLANAAQVGIFGSITALAAGEFAAADGRTDVAVGFNGLSGPVVEVFDGSGTDKFSDSRSTVPLSNPATAITLGMLDDDPFIDVAIAAGNEIVILHGSGRNLSVPVSVRIERIPLTYQAKSVAIGNFTWDRAGKDELAVMSGDGTIHILFRGTLDTRPYTDADRPNRGRLRPVVVERDVDIENLSGWTAAKAEPWSQTTEIPTGTLDHQLFDAAKISSGETRDLLVSGNDQALHLIKTQNTTEKAVGESATADSGFTSVALSTGSSVVDAAVMPRKLNGEGGLVIFSKESPDPTLVPTAVTATIDVDRTDDVAAASACTGAANDCSLRGAITNANSNIDSTTINVPAGLYQLTIAGVGAGGCDGNATGDLEINQDTIIVGAGSGTTTIRQTAGGPTNSRVMCLNTGFLLNIDYQFSGITITGGRDVNSGLAGGGIIGGEKDNTHQFTNVVISNNQVLPDGDALPDDGNIGGGGMQITGGDLTITNCTIGGSNAPTSVVPPGSDRTDATLGNSVNTAGAGIYYTPSAPMHTASDGMLSVSGTTFSRNAVAPVPSIATSGGGGAELEILAFSSPGGIGTGSAQFTGNTQFNTNSSNPSNGGGLVVASLATTISGASFTSNSTGGQGGGIFVGSASLLLDGSVNAISFTNNTASANGGSSISVNNTTTVSGTLVSIGGDVVVNAQGTWTNNNGSTLAPTNFLMFGGIFNGNNSTMNVAGNLTMQPQGGGTTGVTFNANSSAINIAGNFSWTAGGSTPAGSFNAGTGSFNFNGTGAQSITNSASITFFNLTDSNVTNPLTLNNSFNVNGTLNVNGANATLAPVAAAIIGGTGTLTGTGTARVTRTTATAGFLNQYTITNKTLTNLTVDYVGTAIQSISPTTYGPLRLNNGFGATLGGNVTVNGLLSLTAGAMGVGSNTLTINAATTVGTGSITSNANGTVIYNQSSNGQDVRAFNYGNLTFSNFNKVLANTGTIGIAGIFTPGTAVGHTIVGSTINFNGTGAQTIPAFNYHNLTTFGARGANNITLANGGTIGIAAAFSPTATFAGGTYVITNNTVDYNGSGAQTIAAFNYNNLTSSNSGARTLQNGGTIGIAGVFTIGMNAYTVTNSTVNFNGSSLQTIPVFTFNSLTLTNAAGANLAGNVTVGGALTLTSGALGVGSSLLTLNGAVTATGGSLTSATNGTVNYNQGSNGQATVLAANYGNLTFSSFSKTLASSGTIGIAGVFTPGAGTSHTITGSTINFNGAGAQTIPGFTYNNLTSSGPTASRVLDPVNTIKIAGVFTPGTDVYTITGSTVEYNGTSAQVLPTAFTTYNNLILNNSAGTTGFAGLTVLGQLTVQTGTFTSSSTYNNVLINSTMTATAASTINVNGNWTNNGTFNASTSTVVFGGSALQTIGGTQPTTFNNLTINNSNGVNLNATISTAGTLALTSGALSIGGNFLNILGDITVGTGSLVGGASSNISVGGAVAATTLPAIQNGLNLLMLNRPNGLNLGASLDVNNLTLTNGPLSIGNTTLTITGAISTTTGTLVGGTTSNITIGGMGANTTLPGVTSGLNNLTVDRANGITLGASLDISGVLALTSGVITTNANTLVLRSSATVNRSTGHVFGGIEKSQVPASFTFDVGKSGANDYTPVSVANATGGGDLTVRSVAGQQPNLVGTNFLQEYWTLTSAGTLTADLTFNYLQADVVGTESIYRIIRVNSGTVATFNNACPANPCVDIDANTAKIDGVSFFSDWTVGETIPTAANGLITGRLTTSDGTPIEGAVVGLSGTQTRKTITDANGNYRFDNVETTGFYTVTPSRANFTFSPSTRSFNQLGENTEAVFSGSAVQESINPLETAEYFVRQQYVDLLGREPDEGGFNYWSDRILECGANADCVAARRRQVAAAFFIEQEFQLTGAFVYGLYKGSLGRHPLYSEFSVDRTQIVVGPNLDGTKQAFAEGFVSRPEFVTKYQAATDAASFVDALLQQLQNASGVDLTSQRSALIARYGAGSTLTQSRSFVLRDLTENAVFRQAEYNSAFVLTEYFGYLRRDPDLGGYDFWLNILNNREPNNYLGLVCAFITSAEYQERFGSIINRTDRECGQ